MAETSSATRTPPSPAESEALYRRLLGLNPSDQSALFGLTQALRAQGRLGEALALLESAKGRLKLDRTLINIFAEMKLLRGDALAASAAFREVLQADPNNVRAYIGLGRAQIAQNQPDAAEQTFKTALRADEDSVEALAALTELALSRGELETATKLGQQAVNANPKHPLAQTALGLAFARQGHGDFAIQCLKNAVELDPDFHPARLNLAEQLLKQGEVELAGKLFEQLVQAMPNWGAPRHGLARAALMAGQPELTERLLGELIPHESQRLDLRLEYVQALMVQRKLDLAEMALSEALSMAPNVLETELLRADCLRLREQVPEAEAEYRRLAGKYPGRPEAHLSLCMLLEETADFARLESACQDGLVVAPNSGVMRLALARSLLKRNAPEQALHELNLIEPQRLDLLRQIRLERTFGRALEANNLPLEAHQHYLAARKLARDTDAEVVEPEHVPETTAVVSPAGAELVFLLGLPGSGVEVIGRVLQTIDPTLVHADRLAFDIRRVDLFVDAVQAVITPLAQDQVETERARYQLERAKLPLHAGVGMDWVPGSAQCLSLINELYPLARVVLVERDPRDCVAEVTASGALVQTAPLDTTKLARSIKRSTDLIKPVKARLGKRLFCLNANEFIDRPEPSLAALNRFLGTELTVPDWLQEQRTGDPWGALRAAGSWKSLEAGWSAETLEALGAAG